MFLLENLLPALDTLETVYKVAICPRGNLIYNQIHLTKDLKSPKHGALGH